MLGFRFKPLIDLVFSRIDFPSTSPQHSLVLQQLIIIIQLTWLDSRSTHVTGDNLQQYQGLRQVNHTILLTAPISTATCLNMAVPEVYGRGHSQHPSPWQVLAVQWYVTLACPNKRARLGTCQQATGNGALPLIAFRDKKQSPFFIVLVVRSCKMHEVV